MIPSELLMRAIGKEPDQAAAAELGRMLDSLTPLMGSKARELSSLDIDNITDHVVVVKTADETVSSSTTVQDDDQLFFGVGANENWTAEFTLYITTNTFPGFRFTVTVPTGASMVVAGLTMFDGETGQTGYLIVSSGSEKPFNGSGSNNPMILKFTVTVRNGTNGGDVKLRWAQAASSLSTIVKAGSSVVAHRD